MEPDKNVDVSDVEIEIEDDHTEKLDTDNESEEGSPTLDPSSVLRPTGPHI